MSNTENLVADAFNQLSVVLEGCKPLFPSISDTGGTIIRVLKSGGKVMTCGNGGSAADALHMAEELTGRFKGNRRSLPGLALCADPTLITCIANDFGYEHVFSRQLEGLGRPNDLLVAFSSSGNSSSIVRALTTAREQGIYSIAVLGKGGGESKGLANQEIIVPASETARVQEVHTLIMHLWLELVEQASWD